NSASFCARRGRSVQSRKQASRKLVLPCPLAPASTVVCAESSTGCAARLRKSSVSTRWRRSCYSLTQRSMEMSPPFDRHLNGGGQRGGGGFFRNLSVVSRSRAGKPGRVGVSPCSIFAQGSAQKPRGSILPR